MTRSEPPQRLPDFTNRAAQQHRQPGDYQIVDNLQADEKGDAKDRETPAAAQVAVAIDKEVVGFHSGWSILTPELDQAARKAETAAQAPSLALRAPEVGPLQTDRGVVDCANFCHSWLCHADARQVFDLPATMPLKQFGSSTRSETGNR